MRAKIVRDGRAWGDPRIRKVESKPMFGVLVAVTSHKPVGAARAVFFQGAVRTGMESVHCVLTLPDGRRGLGSAGGAGYHKSSAALAEAIRDAGIDLFGNPYGADFESRESRREYKGPQSISGRGYGSMEDAMKAIARAVTGDRKVRLVEVWP